MFIIVNVKFALDLSHEQFYYSVIISLLFLTFIFLGNLTVSDNNVKLDAFDLFLLTIFNPFSCIVWRMLQERFGCCERPWEGRDCSQSFQNLL